MGEKYALVTGASSGIGKATAKELNKRGYTVFACARRVEQMDDLVSLGIQPLLLDITDKDNVQQVKKIIVQKTGNNLDLLYNNAGQSCTMPASDVTDEMILQCFEVNVIAQMRMTREFLPLLINSKGVVLFTGSLAGVAPFPFGSVYGSTKLAIHQYAHGLHLELKPLGVKVVNVITGGVNTDIADKRPLPLDSLYACPEMTYCFAARQSMAVKNKPMSLEKFAYGVVNDLLSSNPPLNIYHGTKSWLVPFFINWFPNWVVELVFERFFKLTPVFNFLKSKYSKKQD